MQLTVDQFTGGLTDFWLGAAKEKWKQCQNLVVSADGKLETTPGSVLDFNGVTRSRIAQADSSYRIGLLAFLNQSVFKQIASTVQYDDGSATTELLGPEGNSAFSGFVSSDDVACAWAYWNDHSYITHDLFQRPIKFFKDSTFKLRTAGLPKPLGTPAFIGDGSGSDSFLYAFVYRYTYLVNGVTFLNHSRPLLITRADKANAATSVDVTNLVLTNGSGEHYDINSSDLVVEMYRTTTNGNTYYFVGESPNNSIGTIADTFNDTTLVDQRPVYFTGGVAFDYRPPAVKYTHATTNFGFYANGFEVDEDLDNNGELLKNRVWQSKEGNPDSVPAQFFVDLEDEITGISSVRSIPIVFCRGSMYRLDGFFDDFGRGGLIAQKISDTVGAAGHLSIIQTLDGIFFAGNDGFYFTDGYRVSPLSDDFRETYKFLVQDEVQKKRIYGAHDPIYKRAFWAVRFNQVEGNDNNTIFVLDTRTGAFKTMVSGYEGNGPAKVTTADTTSGSNQLTNVADVGGIEVGQYVFADGIPANTFVTAVGLTTVDLSEDATATAVGGEHRFLTDAVLGTQFFEQFQPSAIAVPSAISGLTRLLYRSDVRGYTFIHSVNSPTNPKIDPTVADTNAWQKNPILYHYISSGLDFGAPGIRKWVNYIIAKMRSKYLVQSNITVQVQGENDSNLNPQDLAEINIKQYLQWGQAGIVYGDPALWQLQQKLVDQKRRFPANSLRCGFKQIHFKNCYINLNNSDTAGEAAVAGIGEMRTLTLTGIGAGMWAGDVVDYYITFEESSYETTYKVLSRDSASQITIADPTDSISLGDKKWLLQGIRKGDIISLLEYTLDFQHIGDSQQPYQGKGGVNV